MLTEIFTYWLSQMAGLRRRTKQFIVFSLDMLVCVASILLAYSLRIGVWVYWDFAIQKVAIAALLLMIPAFYITGVYRAIFRYAGTGMMKTLVRGFAIYTAGMILIFTIIGIDGVPKTVGVIQPIIFFIAVGFIRVTTRYLMVDILGRNSFGGKVRRILIYGAGSAGQQLASSMRSEPAIQLVGFIDDDQRLDGQKLDGRKVYFSKKLPRLIERYNIDDIMLALPGISRKKRRTIVREVQQFKVHVQTLPNVKEIMDGKVSFNDIRELDIEDLLGREAVSPNELLMSRTIIGKTVLVTGAGGSIGSELCRQILTSGVRRLVLFERTEFSLYKIEKELRTLALEQGLTAQIIPILGSAIDPARLKEVFAEWQPDTVYHAAAYKHVPLVEANPVEGIRNNVIGTYETVDAAFAAKVSDFILISTDKAVRPTNIMGATKRAAEQIVQVYAAQKTNTRFSMVRFGNVLGSSGSVVPLFRQQIEAGGPVTLTHKDVTRYFMTIPEAAQLVIQAAGMAKGGEVFVLDMGKAVRIIDLAETMIQLSGFTVRDEKRPDGDIEINEVGLRPGEKLYEELIIGNDPQKTVHERIMMAHENHVTRFELDEVLIAMRSCRKLDNAVPLLQRLVPEFEHRRDNLATESA